MLDRIFLCLFGSLGFLIALVLLSSTKTPEGTTHLSYFALYADLFLTMLVCGALLGAHVLPLLFLCALNRRPMPPEEATALVKLSQDEMQPTTVSVIENYKSQLLQIEERVRYLQTSELHVRQFYKEDPGGFAIWLCERGLSILRKQCWKESGTAASLRQDIARLYGGDVDFEVRNLREQIAQLVADKDTGGHSYDPERINHGWNKHLDKQIRAYQRQIDELQQWSKKVTTAQALPANQSPDEIAFQNFVNDIKRTAGLSIVQASSQMEAALAGIEARRFYLETATERWQRGTLTDREFEFIKKRVDEAFLGDSTSIYA